MAAPPPRPTRPGRRNVTVLRALYDYTAQREDELSFREGDVLYILDGADPSSSAAPAASGWLRARRSADPSASDAAEGLVPANYVSENTAAIENPLHEAAKRGNGAFVQELLDAGVSANALDRGGQTPLHWAARGGHADVVAQLLGASPPPQLHAQNRLGDTPLHMAAWGGHLAAVERLVAAMLNEAQPAQPRVSLQIANQQGETPRQLAKSDAVAACLVQAEQRERLLQQQFPDREVLGLPAPHVAGGSAEGLVADDDYDSDA